ncbi:MAG: VOC family protein [Planctomycetota bacterium]|nr:VOC family protein [Planctomycetota bacterium]
MKAKHYQPEGNHTITPYLIIPDPVALIEFTKKVFGAEETMRMTCPQGTIVHAEVRIGDSPLEFATASEQWPAMPASLHVYVADADAAFQRALAAGGTVIKDIADQFYGERSGSIRDSNGNAWHIATKTEELTEAEMKQRAADYMAKSGS